MGENVPRPSAVNARRVLARPFDGAATRARITLVNACDFLAGACVSFA